MSWGFGQEEGSAWIENAGIRANWGSDMDRLHVNHASWRYLTGRGLAAINDCGNSSGRVAWVGLAVGGAQRTEIVVWESVGVKPIAAAEAVAVVGFADYGLIGPNVQKLWWKRIVIKAHQFGSYWCWWHCN